jgi:hypothetical protein
MEEWRVINNFPNYSVSNLGNVRNDKFGRIMKPSITPWGYYHVTLSVEGKLTKKCIHKLVAETFLPNWNNHTQCDHINRIKTDNRYFNLRWISNSNNNRNVTKQKNTSSKYFCVSFNKRDKIWQVQTKINYKLIYIGSFKTEDEAALAYNDYIIQKNLQEFSPLNVIV